MPTASVITAGPSNIFGVFSDADFPYPTVTLSDGESVKLDSSTFSVARMSPNREDRQKVMAAFFGALGQFTARSAPR